MTRLKSLLAAAVLVAGAAAPRAARAQSATDVLRRVTDGAHGRAAGVSDYTVRMSLLAGSFTTFIGRRSQSDPFRVQYAAQGAFAQSSTILAWADALLLMLQDARAMRARRSWLSYSVDSVGGTPVHVVTATFPRNSPWNGGSRPRTFTVRYDTTTLLPRRLEIVTERRNLPDAHLSVEFTDYRPIQGAMQIPFTRRVVMTGLRDTYSPEAIAGMRQLVAGLRADLSRQPEAERARGARVADTLERVLEHDELVQDVTVASAVVNQGAPAGIALQPIVMP